MLLSPRRLCPGPPDRHGSALVLIIVSLMLLLIMGAAYLQTARSDRMAFAPGPAEDAALSDKATAIAAIEDFLKKTLLDDLTNDNNSSLLSVTDGDEIYDYPWTNGSASRTVFREAAPTNPVSSDGGTLDDTWLASTVPDISGAQPVWQHLTSLTGLYLRIPKAFNPSGYLTPWASPTDDGENIIENDNASEWTWHDTNVAMLGADSLASTSMTNWEPLGVDADQDGFPDSRWEWAPKRQINNTMFIMAVRIVDNSSMLNVNTMGAVTDGTNYSVDPVRGYFPSSLDASRLMSLSKNGGGANSNWATELRASFYDRLGSTPSLPMPVGVTAPLATWSAATNSLAELWLAVPTYDNDDETELRRRGGVNDETATLPIETALGNLVDSSRMGDATGYPQLGGSPTTTQAQAFFIGGPHSTPIESRDYEHIRHLLTTHSGASMLTEEHKLAESYNQNFQYDLHDAALSGSPNVSDLAGMIAALLQDGNNYGGYSDAQLNDMGTELAVNIVDYSDSDTVPTKATSLSGTTFWGFEMLPVLREFYAHGAYRWLGNDTYQFRTNERKSKAMAYEIGNPFDRDITNTMLSGNIKVEVRTDDNILRWSQILGGSGDAVSPAALPLVCVPAGGSMLIYHRPESDNPTESGEGTAWPGSFNIPGGSATVIYDGGRHGPYAGNDNKRIWIPTSSGAGSKVMRLDLFVKDSTGYWVLYDSLDDPDMKFIHEYNNSGQNGVRFGQKSVRRDGRNIRFISDRGLHVNVRTPATKPWDSNIERFGEDDKSVSGDTALDAIQIFPWANHQMFSATEVAMIPLVAVTNSTPLGERVDTMALNRVWLDTSAGAVTGGSGVPHASVLFDALAAAGTELDGIDNNGSGTVDENGEWVMRGSMNINTVPRFLLALSMASPESFSDITAMVDSIIEYRKGTSRQLPAGGRTNPGIAYTGELLYMNPGGGSSATDMRRYESVTMPATLDLIPHPDDPAVGVDATLSQNMAQKRTLARLQLITQAYRPRSDIYTAYLIMRAYSEQAGAFDFTGTFKETRLIYQLDRTTVSQSGGSVACTELYREGD